MDWTKVIGRCNAATLVVLVGTMLCDGCSADSVDPPGMGERAATSVAPSDAAGAGPQASTVSPYANQAPSPIRGLSAQEYDDLQQGRGMGMARAAELNSYPGPRDVLIVADQLQLGAAAATAIKAIYEETDGAAREVGAQVLSKEQLLNDAFWGAAQ